MDQPVDPPRNPPQWQSTPAYMATANNTTPRSTQPTQPPLTPPLLPPLPSQPNGLNGNPRYTNPTNSLGQNPPTTGGQNPEQRTTTPPGSGLNFPAPPSTSAPGNTASTTSPSPTTPEIRAGMFSLPANAELQTASGLPATSTNQQNQPPAVNSANNQTAAAFDWQTPTNNQPVPPLNDANQSSDGSGTPLLVLSWVLLSGSVFSNAYLFWNYFDVRQKYRGMVHNTRDSNRRYSSHD